MYTEKPTNIKMTMTSAQIKMMLEEDIECPDTMIHVIADIGYELRTNHAFPSVDPTISNGTTKRAAHARGAV
jgi:hypothetical protein